MICNDILINVDIVFCEKAIHWSVLSVRLNYKPGYKICDLLRVRFLLLVEITVFRLEKIVQPLQGSTDGILFQEIPIFFNNRNWYLPPILEADY